jgi:hypothetical protein
LGSELLVETLLRRFTEVQVQGRVPRLYAPAPLAQALQMASRGRCELDCRPYGEHSRFVAAVDVAEHAFYWNWSSHSIVRRLTTGRPVSFFGRGHVCALLPGVAERLRSGFYARMQPCSLALDQPLHAPSIGNHHAVWSVQRMALAACYQELPTLADTILGLD